MATNALWLKIDGEGVVHDLLEAREKLDTANGEVVLDFSAVHRVDASALRAMECLADTVDGKGPKIVLRGINVDIYKVLKLMKLAPRFSFRT